MRVSFGENGPPDIPNYTLPPFLATGSPYRRNWYQLNGDTIVVDDRLVQGCGK